ncbi:putative methyltransferase [Acholeplasma oculi]|uniref:N6 adenine-speicific DNA methyltransferase, D21 class n=1 Tax=Acholeplasma oculi TaxID=35623 RepID=A0A061A8N0_9MOLU|nr:site-specific DNA-methyltransferase [Acholeplasma oculi]CDR30235.1 N6 adenine-speicific DNA methyltransferase, D21 class [Acholeplasma oculi]SKC43684.1 adenine-specific DNA-methyltransferase [Acholeplasma oculi]SUT88630.1 putative methyltransferase [Acholeplasma oculi]
MNNLLTILETILFSDVKYLDDNGRLLKGKLQEDAINLNPDLIRLLLSNDIIVKTFFVKVDNALIFNSLKFSWVISNREFLPDSYTRFKNRIGLTDKNNNYLSNINDVVLTFPYKDNLLVGGQSSEDEKRNEVFINETLMQNDIDVLLEPKVFTNVNEYYSKKSSIFEKNIMLKGNNLIAVSSLLKTHKNSIKFIYLDPPYNTEGAANTFSYNNSFNHSTWLVFMKNRLEIAYKLLTDDGVIAIAIDDFEYAHLKVLCDELFTRENYVGTIIVQSNPRGRTINSNFATCHEYCLYYAKDITKVNINNLDLTTEQENLFNNSDQSGNYRYLPFRRSGGTSTPEERPNSEFTLYYSKSENNIIAIGGNRKGGIEYVYEPMEILQLNEDGEIVELNPESFNNNPDIVPILPIDVNGRRRVWRWSDRLKILTAARNGDFKVQADGRGYYVQLKDRIKSGRKPKTIWDDSRYDASSSGTILLKKMFDGEKPFSYPKSIYTMIDTLKIITNDDDIILDFFGGSGTTAHAVLELNKLDGGNRRFIIVEQMNYFDTVTVPRVRKVYEQLISEKAEVNPLLVMELKKLNGFYLDKINESDDSSLELLFNDIIKNPFIISKPNSSDVSIKDDFTKMSFSDQRKLLVEILDKNMLYVNYSDIDDEEMKVSSVEKKYTRNFYGEK